MHCFVYRNLREHVTVVCREDPTDPAHPPFACVPNSSRPRVRRHIRLFRQQPNGVPQPNKTLLKPTAKNVQRSVCLIYFFFVKQFRQYSPCLFESVALAFLPGDSLEVAHVGRVDRRPDYSQMVDLGHLATRLVVSDKQLNVLHILELDVAQVDRVSVQILGA